jgi:hypothetical protein
MADPVTNVSPNWQAIETAPKDGRAILLLSAPDTIRYDGEDHDRPARVAIGHWNPEGDSWVDEIGDPNGDAYTLEKTGLWMSGGGWFQSNEVTHWMPLPELPKL